MEKGEYIPPPVAPVNVNRYKVDGVRIDYFFPLPLPLPLPLPGKCVRGSPSRSLYLNLFFSIIVVWWSNIF